MEFLGGGRRDGEGKNSSTELLQQASVHIAEYMDGPSR